MIPHICYLSDFQLFSILRAIETLNQVSVWDKISAVSVAASVIISLILAGRGWYQNNRISWLSIRQIHANLSYTHSAPTVPVGISLYVGITRRKDIPLEILASYVFLSSKECDVRLGFLPRTKNIQSIIQGNVYFDLMRTVAIDEEKLHEKISIDEFYERTLKSQKISTLNKGEIDIHTNAGVYSKKLSKQEIKQWISIFEDIKNKRRECMSVAQTKEL